MMAPSGVVTLTTDFGTQDSYVGTMKGVILRIFPDVRLADITHQIGPQDTLEASLILESAYPYFPHGTVHVAVVDPGVGTDRRPLLVVSQDHYFVGPDNGLFTRILENAAIEGIYHITNSSLMLPAVSDTFHGRDVFAPAAAYLARGVAVEEFGPPVDDPDKISIPDPRVYPNQICGQIIYVDSFGNMVTNITRTRLDELVRGRRVRISINGKKIDTISRSYLDGTQGMALAIFGSTELLEIAVSGGRADRRMGAGKGDTVFVDVLHSTGESSPPAGFDY